jgi:hypothetical protein
MLANLAAEIAALPRRRVSELRVRFAKLFGEPTPSHNKVWLVKCIAWRLQAQAQGNLSERARRRAAELAAAANLRLSAPPADADIINDKQPATLRIPVDDRLPRPGTILTRRYKGRMRQVEVLADGFAYDGQTYRSLSAVDKAVTGSHCSGHFFFGLTAKGPQP